MLLNAVETGDGDDVVILLHGMTGSAESWWRIAPVLAERGQRVLALDLPGHGLSYRDPHLTIDIAAQSLIETVQMRTPGRRLTAVGHSYGGTVLAAAADRLSLSLAVYVDTICAFDGGQDHDALTARYERDRQRRMDAAWLRGSRPFYSATDASVEARAAERFDPATSAAISCGDDVAHPPGTGSILVRAAPSAFVSDADAERLTSCGVDVRSIPGAAHTIWYSHFDEFCTALPELFGT